MEKLINQQHEIGKDGFQQLLAFLKYLVIGAIGGLSVIYAAQVSPSELEKYIAMGFGAIAATAIAKISRII